MNIHHFRSSTQFQDPSPISLKNYSPSYTSTAQSLQSNFVKSNHTLMSSNRNFNQENLKNYHPNQNIHQKQKPQATKNQSNPYVVIDSIKWNNYQGLFTSQMELHVQYTVKKQLDENITWQVVYFGSAFSENYDQTLIQFETQENQTGQLFPQKRQFKLMIQPPKPNLIQPKELFNITAIVINAFYKNQQFVKIGYYVHYQLPVLNQNQKNCISKLGNNEKFEQKQDNKKKIPKRKKIGKNMSKRQALISEYVNQETSGSILDNILQRTVRTILMDKPRITKFEIDWQKQIIPKKQLKPQIQGESTQILQNQHLITEYLKPQKFFSL